MKLRLWTVQQWRSQPKKVGGVIMFDLGE